MKFNWGTGVAIALISFIIFIAQYFVRTLYFPEKYNHELVTQNYYGQELAYQKMVKTEEKTNSEGMQVDIAYEKGEGVTFFFPDLASGKEIIGVVKMYRPNNETADFELPIKVIENQMHIDHKNLLSGRWNIILEYVINQQEYRTSFKISY
ncbi:MAG: FixH family protein [Flavobacteriaceae bacterium]|nr:FixH family protein [Flavobacteriaceae bacterium]